MTASERLRTEIRPCTREDLERVAEIHKSQFLAPCALLAQLSPPLIAATYAAFLDRSIFLVHSSDGEVDGFVLGGSSSVMPRCRLSFIREHALAGMAEVVRRPKLWLLTFRSMVKLIGKWLASIGGPPPKEEFRLMTIAIAAQAARRGVGTALVECFEAAIRPRCRAYSLNVARGNTSARRFYAKLGFQVVSERAFALKLRKDLTANDDMPDAKSP